MGRVIVDAGWHEEIRTNPKEHFGEELYRFIEYRSPLESSVREQLKSKGLTPADVDIVVVTHLDKDHISGLRLLNGAKRFLVSEPEWKHAVSYKEKWDRGTRLSRLSLNRSLWTI